MNDAVKMILSFNIIASTVIAIISFEKDTSSVIIASIIAVSSVLYFLMKISIKTKVVVSSEEV